MKIDAFKFGLATALVVALAWLICSVLVLSAPTDMMQMSGQMVHADFGQMSWHLNWGGIFVGLIAWSIIAGVIAWAIAAIYNRLIS